MGLHTPTCTLLAVSADAVRKFNPNLHMYKNTTSFDPCKSEWKWNEILIWLLLHHSFLICSNWKENNVSNATRCAEIDLEISGRKKKCTFCFVHAYQFFSSFLYLFVVGIECRSSNKKNNDNKVLIIVK